MYAAEVREAVSGSIDTSKLAEAWTALHPSSASKEVMPNDRESDPSHNPSGLDVNGAGQACKAISPVLSAFLSRASRAIQTALRPVLTRLWTEGWVLGSRSALAASEGLADVDWGGWKPGDYA